MATIGAPRTPRPAGHRRFVLGTIVALAAAMLAPATALAWDITRLTDDRPSSAGDHASPSLAVAPDGSLRMVVAKCGGARDGVRFGSNASGSWTWTWLSDGCARRAALALDAAGHAHVAWVAGGGASYATDASGSWVTNAVPTPEDGVIEVAIASDADGTPLVVQATIYDDAGLHAPEMWAWRPGDAQLTWATAGEHPSVAIGDDGPVVGSHDWFFDIYYQWRRPSLATKQGGSWLGEALAPAGRAAAVAVAADGSVHAAFARLGAPIAYVATGETFPDALAASAAAARNDGMVALSRRSSLPAPTGLELSRLRPDQIHVVGGIGAVSERAEAQATTHAYTGSVNWRLSGDNRYETAAAVTYGDPYDCCATIFITSGTDFPDALAGSVLVGKSHAGLLLVTRDDIPVGTRSRIYESQDLVILGGPGAVSSAVEAELVKLVPHGSVERIYGPDRYATAAAIAARAYPMGAPVAYLATGEAFPDGLAAGPAARHEGGPLLLTRKGDLPAATRNQLLRLHPDRVVVVGGTGAISTAVSSAVKTALPGVRVVRVAGADRYETAAALSAYAFPESAGLWHQDLSDAGMAATFVTTLIPTGPLDLAIAPDGTARIAFAGPEEAPGVYLATSDVEGDWTVSRITTDARDSDPTVVVAEGRVHVAWDRGVGTTKNGVFIAAE